MSQKIVNELMVDIYLKSGRSLMIMLDPEKYTCLLDVLSEIPRDGFVYIKTRMSNRFRRFDAGDIAYIDMIPSMGGANNFLDDFIEFPKKLKDHGFFPTSSTTLDFTGIKV